MVQPVLSVGQFARLFPSAQLRGHQGQDGGNFSQNRKPFNQHSIGHRAQLSGYLLNK